MEFPSQDVSKTCSILFSAKFGPFSNLFRGHALAVHDERVEWTYSWNILCVKRETPPRMEVEPLWVSTYKKHISFGNKFDCVEGVIISKGGPEPLENEINKILDSKHEDRFSDHFSDLVQNICSVRFSYLLRLSIFCRAPRDMRKFPQKRQKIAGCWESAVYGSRPPIASKPDSSPPERPGRWWWLLLLLSKVV